MKKRVLISVTDKTGVEKFATLVEHDWEIISTGGTAKALAQAEIPCTQIEEVTGFPEMLDGRLKTLHPNIFGGILADRFKAEHIAALLEHGIEMIDLVVVNLYDFDKKPGIENIDIGGPSLLRAASKNGASIGAVIDPQDYDMVIGELVERGCLASDTREYLAIKVFRATGLYDIAISHWMGDQQLKGLPIFGATVVSSH